MLSREAVQALSERLLDLGRPENHLILSRLDGLGLNLEFFILIVNFIS